MGGRILALKIEYALIAQSAERVLGKDEVTSSNLVKSSTETRIYAGFLLFVPLCFYCNFNANVMQIFFCRFFGVQNPFFFNLI